MFKTFKITLPIQLIIAVLTAFIIHKIMPVIWQQYFYTFSSVMKEILVLILPAIIFSSVYKAFANINNQSQSGAIVVKLIFFIVLSNSISLIVSGLFNYSYVFKQFNNLVTSNVDAKASDFIALWSLDIPQKIANEWALISALFLGITPIGRNVIVKKAGIFLDSFSCWFMAKFFIPFLPLFIFGFMCKLLQDNIMNKLHYFNPSVTVGMFSLEFVYLAVLGVIATLFYKKNFVIFIKSILPPALTAFSTMSSAAALPLSLRAAYENTNNKEVSDLVMPITVNIHMIGDTICIPIMAAIIMNMFGMSAPSLNTYLIFMIGFLLTKFSGAGVPGGSILVMIPVLEKYLGFNSEMTALITAFYMIADPLTTSGNVIGNNIFAMYFTKLMQKKAVTVVS